MFARTKFELAVVSKGTKTILGKAKRIANLRVPKNEPRFPKYQ